MNMILVRLGLGLVLLVALGSPAEAYIGPGAGLTAIGTVLALFGAILMAIVGFLWYPIKRLRARRRERAQTVAREAED